MSSIGFSWNDFPQFVGPTTRMFAFFCLPFKTAFLSTQAKKKTLVLLFCDTSFAHFSNSPWQLAAHSPAAWLGMIEIRIQCWCATVPGAAYIFHVVVIKSDKAFGDLFKIKSERSFSPFPLLCNAACTVSDSFLMLFMVTKSETLQSVSVFFFTTFFWVLGGVFFLCLLQKNVSS